MTKSTEGGKIVREEVVGGQHKGVESGRGRRRVAEERNEKLEVASQRLGRRDALEASQYTSYIHSVCMLGSSFLHLSPAFTVCAN